MTSVFSCCCVYHPYKSLIFAANSSYSNESDLILDNCMGSGSTIVACKNTSRDYIGIELNEDYADMSVERMKNHDIIIDIGMYQFYLKQLIISICHSGKIHR